jgi:HAD superfamily hydrolase (TIGR01450 family)
VSAQPTIKTSIAELSQAYDGFLFDAYGVLCDGSGALPFAGECISFLRNAGKGILVVTNGASMLPEQNAAKYRAMGLDIGDTEVLNSLSLVSAYFVEHRLQGSKTVVLGTEASKAYVARCGGDVVASPHEDFSVVIVANQTEYSFVESVDLIISAVAAKIQAGKSVHCVLPNPDFLYPKSPGAYGITAGAVAELIERGVEILCGVGRCQFQRLGKPYGPIFEAARSRFASGSKLVMIGDQLETDIKGARAAGIADVLVTTGVASGWRVEAADHFSRLPQPSFVIPNLDPCS